MKLHGNARTCPKSRELIARRVMERGWSLVAAAEAAGVSEPTARKWVRRWAAGDRQLLDRCSAPKRIPHRTSRRRVEAIEALRRLRLTAAEIAAVLGMALSTVSVWLKRLGLGKRSRLEPPEPPNRYERRRAGELVHIDVKKLGRIRGVGHRVTGDRGPGKRNRGIGWDFVHVCIDDHTRLAYVEIHPDEHPATAVAFLRRALGWFAQRGVRVERVMTDNGNPYRSQLHNIACRELELKHLRTRPYRPRTNGKAERFIQTLLREWAYGRVYGSTSQRTQTLQGWLNHYNYKRPHGSLGHKPPGSRLNNEARNYT
jgi:transposase InsO family protein